MPAATVLHFVSDQAELWRRHDAMERALSAPLSARMLALAALQSGMRVLDVASGRGEPALPAARAVGPGGFVLATDLDADVLALARERAEGEGLSQVQFRAIPAERLAALDEAPFDAAFVRWGLMYMADPVAALSAVAACTQAHAPLVLALWADAEQVDYFSLPRAVLARHVELDRIDPDVPGPFRYGRIFAIEAVLHAAGWRLDMIEDMRVEVAGYAEIDQLIDWTLDFGMRRLLVDCSAEVRAAWHADMRAELSRLPVVNGCRHLGGVTRLVRALQR